MLRPEPMQEVMILVRKRDAKQVIEKIARLKALHLIDHKKEHLLHSDVDIGTPEQTAEALSDALVRARAILAKIGRAATEDAQQIAVEDRIARVREIAQQYAQHEEILAESSKDLEEMQRQDRLLAMLPGDDAPIGKLLRAKSLAPILARATQKSDTTVFSKLPILTVAHNDPQNTVFLTARAKDAQATKDTLVRAQYELVDLASLKNIDDKTADARKQLAEQITVAHHRIAQARLALGEFHEHIPFLAQSERVLAYELLKAQAPLHFGATKTTLLIRAYVPDTRTEELTTIIEGMNIPHVMQSRPAAEAPTKLNNPKGLRNFETLIELYQLPKYHEIDPTSIMAITFPLFFGFMLGDIGYAACIFLLFAYLRKKYPGIRGFANILMISAVSGIVFGFFFGEFFGMEQFLGITLHPIIHRATDVTTMLLIAVAIGMFHVNLGLVLGMINESRDGWFFAIIKKGSWMLLQAGFIMFLATQGTLASIPVLGALHPTMFATVTTLLFAVAGVIIGEHARGLLELPMIFSHTLSYTRLVAIGLASVSLALVTNDLGSSMFAKGGVWIIIAVLIVIVGHTINLALGLMGPFLHSLRLHYAEFFMKFYEGGGRPFRAFGAEETA